MNRVWEENQWTASVDKTTLTAVVMKSEELEQKWIRDVRLRRNCVLPCSMTARGNFLAVADFTVINFCKQIVQTACYYKNTLLIEI